MWQTPNWTLSEWGSVASIAGLIIAVLGFIITLYKIFKIQKVAEATRKQIRRLDIGMELEMISGMFNELRAMLRQEPKNWEMINDRFSTIRKKLILIKERHPDLTKSEKQVIQGKIQHISNIEKVIGAGFGSMQFPSSSKLNNAIIEISNELEELFARLYG